VCVCFCVFADHKLKFCISINIRKKSWRGNRRNNVESCVVEETIYLEFQYTIFLYGYVDEFIVSFEGIEASTMW